MRVEMPNSFKGKKRRDTENAKNYDRRPLFVKENIPTLLLMLIIVVFIAVVLMACGDDDDGTYSSDGSGSNGSNNTQNDTILNQSQYDEYFKQEGGGDKNYLYTETEFENDLGQHCTVITGASERWGAISCAGEQSNSASLIPPIEEENR